MAETSAETTPQTLLEQLQADFDIQPGEVDMLIMDMPHIPPQGLPVLMQIADAGQKERTNPGSEPLYTTVGVCVHRR